MFLLMKVTLLITSNTDLEAGVQSELHGVSDVYSGTLWESSNLKMNEKNSLITAAV